MKETSALIDKACRNLNIDSLNGMQKQMLETATRPNDIILLSPTGSGKTLAFLLPVLSRISPKIAGVQALVIVPSGERFTFFPYGVAAVTANYFYTCGDFTQYVVDL